MICSSGIGFDARLDGKRLLFGFHGIYQGTAVLYDRDTRSLWMHFTGACIAGPRKGRQLAPLRRGRHTTWAAWRAAHPKTRVMAPDPARIGQPGDAGYFPRAQAHRGGRFLPKGFAETIELRDDRLPLATLVLGVRVGAARRAYAFDALQRHGVVEERIGDVDATIWFDRTSRSAAAFDRRHDGRVLSFVPTDGGLRHERATDTLWDMEGRCVEGRLRGQRLQGLESLQTEWYGWYALHPDTSLLTD